SLTHCGSIHSPPFRLRGANYISRPEQPLKPIHNSRSWHLPLLTCAVLAIAGCSETPAGTSVDANAFAKSIRLGAPVQSVRFEIVTLPENQGSGGLPGPTDYVALIGSASLSDM
ncbi:hypothetical protein, partial [Ralstonia solanacearum]